MRNINIYRLASHFSSNISAQLPRSITVYSHSRSRVHTRSPYRHLRSHTHTDTFVSTLSEQRADVPFFLHLQTMHGALADADASAASHPINPIHRTRTRIRMLHRRAHSVVAHTHAIGGRRQHCSPVFPSPQLINYNYN